MTAALEPAPHAGVALEINDATVNSLVDQKRVVLEHLNWTVREGDYWAVGGLHGSGKSDFICAAAGILPLAEGKYRLFGKEIIHGFEPELLSTRLRVGLVFDGGRLLNHLSVAENVALPLQYHSDLGADAIVQRVRQLLELIELLPLAERYPASISWNHQQRVGLARALALKPALLLLDSPLTGLDPQDANWWLETLDRLAVGHAITDGRPVTLVATADDLRPWRGHARQFAVLRNKQLREVVHVEAQRLTDDALMREMIGRTT
jgi:ABC-type transporter Mla maintaining outer membrane lipid asymmetry ATPase subunit MlaF